MLLVRWKLGDEWRIFSFAVLVIVAGCAVPRAGMVMPDGSTVYTIRPRLELVDARRQPVPSVGNPKDILLVFAVIPGEIYGEVNDVPLQVIPAVINFPFPLDLGDMSKDIHRKAQSLRVNSYTKELIVTPQNARFARIATFAADQVTKKGIDSSGFLDSASRDGLILIYVDRACTITGTQHLLGDNRQFDVTLRYPGFHWIHVAGTGSKSLHLKEFDGEQTVIFAISQTP